MRKGRMIFLALSILLVLAGCGNGEPQESGTSNPGSASHEASSPSEGNPSAAAPDTAQGGDSNILIAYFSRVGNTDFPDDIDAVSSASLLRKDGELYGNTQYIASLIQQRTGGDLFLIETEEKYPSVYEQIDEQGGEEHRNGVRPKLASHVDSMDDYSVIFLGYPIWYYDLPMAVYSFLKEYDLSGKTIIPFVTSGASGFTGTLTNVKLTELSIKNCEKQKKRGLKSNLQHSNFVDFSGYPAGAME